jgi:hypothetical protein
VLLATTLAVASCMVPHQPVAMFYVDDGRPAERQLRVIARSLGVKYKMGTVLEPSERKSWETDVFTFFAATNNGLLFRLALSKGSEATFDLTYAWKRIDISVSGPPDHPDVHGLVADWTAALDAAKIKYRFENRTPMQTPPR